MSYWSLPGFPQEPHGSDLYRRPEPLDPAFAKPQPATPPLHPILPPIPLPPAEPQESLPTPRVFVRHVQITGNTVFSEADLAVITRAYENRLVTSEELETLRIALTQFYINAGYITSGAILPDQTITDGVITLRIIEGTLTNITVTGNRWFRDAYLRPRLTPQVRTPLRISTLQERLQLLQQDDRMERLEAELRPGVQLGESELQVRVTERLPFLAALEFNNYQSPSIGAERGLLTLAHRNVTGHGDVLSVSYGRSAGLDLQLDASYTLPLTAQDTTLHMHYRRNHSSVIEELSILDIKSRSEIFTLTLRHPLYRSLQHELSLALSGERLQSHTSLLGEPAPFVSGDENGRATDTALRLVAEWIDRTPNQVIAARSRFSLGINALEATIHRDSHLPDGRFFAWLGQLQWGRRLPLADMQILLRLDIQLANEPLLPLEQIAVGGRFSVRGYRENYLVRDNALIASLETPIPLLRNTPWAELMQIVPFVDFGRGWNLSRTQQEDTLGPTNLVSVGLGVRWATTFQTVMPLRTQFEVFWGYPCTDVERNKNNLQDHGLHLQFIVSAF